MFYHFNQNNSGGSFDFDETAGITHHVVIEARSASEANEKAEALGLYFNGEGDCPCCGNRWSSQWWDEDGSDEPLVYGSAPNDPNLMRWMEAGKEVVVHYADGRMSWY